MPVKKSENSMIMIQILLATYNSHAFLAEQLDSLMAQSCQDFEILISDGGSCDDTLEIISGYQERFPGKIRFLGSEPASACENFGKLLAAAAADYVMFCDHDDVWKSNKIAISLDACCKAEAESGTAMPILVFTDSEIVDHALVTTGKSMVKTQRLNTENFAPERIFIQNVASGNTMLFNAALKNLILPISKAALMHDHWVAAMAAVFGKIVFVNEPAIKYRQHGKNVLGAFRYGIGGFLRKAIHDICAVREKLYCKIDQGIAVLESHPQQLSVSQQQLLDGMRNFKNLSWLEMRVFLWKNGFRMEGFLRNTGLFLIV